MAAELLSPAGDFDTALSAFEAGADAVYCGLAEFSARASAKNLTLDELKNLLAYARGAGRNGKVYVAFNTLLNDEELPRAVSTLATLADIGPDAIIVQDLGVARICRRHFPALELHASTQLVAHNLEGVLALKEMGFRRVVLARELSLDEISLIARRCGAFKIMDDGRPEMELECFIHGALCYSISGLCLFGAMEKGRSGNRGACPYCCREERFVNGPRGEYSSAHPFSMKDLRLGESARLLSAAGVSSLKIEGRMKSSLYVATVTSYYRQILDGKKARVTLSDLETVFSRRTTELYFRNRPGEGVSPVDDSVPGHVGAPAGTLKRITGSRDGRYWLCFRSTRQLELHDGLQFDVEGPDGRRLGMGISEMWLANPHRNVCEAPAGSDVEVLLPGDAGRNSAWMSLKPGMTVYCSMSNSVKKMFPCVSFRPSDYPGIKPIDPQVCISQQSVTARVGEPVLAEAVVPAQASKANDPSRTDEAVRKAFGRLGGTDYRLGSVRVENDEGLFVPMGVLNTLRRALVGNIDKARRAACEQATAAALEAIVEDIPSSGFDAAGADESSKPVLKLRTGQVIPPGEWKEVVLSISPDGVVGDGFGVDTRIALPVWTPETDFNKLRSSVKRLLRAGYLKWEASDLATLRMLKHLGVTDVTADWTIYVRNSSALAELSDLGVKRFVASPENDDVNHRRISESGFDVEFLVSQSTPLFLSLTSPKADGDIEGYSVFRRDGLFVTTRREPFSFTAPESAPRRVDISWDFEQ